MYGNVEFVPRVLEKLHRLGTIGGQHEDDAAHLVDAILLYCNSPFFGPDEKGYCSIPMPYSDMLLILHIRCSGSLAEVYDVENQ